MVQLRNLASFNAALRKFSKSLTEEQLPVFVRKIGLELVSRIVRKTPVDTGRARGNWQVTLGAPAFGENLLPDPIAAASGVLAGFRSGAVYISNNVPYIVRLERGWSKQAPKGMVDLSLAEVRSIFP